MNFCKDLPGQLDRVIKDALLIFGAPLNGMISEDLTVYSFPQMWGSTALGHGGIGGCALTTAQTWVVFSPNREVLVYFGDRLAYGVPCPSDAFLTRMRDANMPGVRHADIAELSRDGIVNYPPPPPTYHPGPDFYMKEFRLPVKKVTITPEGKKLMKSMLGKKPRRKS